MALCLALPTSHASQWLKFKIGPAINIQDNIRPENGLQFFEHNPITEPFPSLILQLGPLVVNKDGGGLALYYTKNLKIAATLLYEGEPYYGPGMDKRLRSFYLGGYINFHQIIFQYYKDVYDRSHGSVFKLTAAPEFRFNQFMISPRPYIQYWDNSYVDYYFGVKETEIDPVRNRYRYQGSATINYGFLIRSVYTSGPWEYFTSFGNKWYGKEVESSPTVKSRKERRFVLGFIYNFI